VSALANLLAKSGKGGPPSEPDGDEGGGDPKAMAAASCKAFFDACAAGDFDAAAEHLDAAVEHCGSMGEGGDALLIAPKK